MKSINYALLFFSCIVFHVLATWSVPLIDRDEPRFAEASREMIERGDYIVPQIVGPSSLILGQVVYIQQGTAGNIPLAAAFAVVPILIMGLLLTLAKRMGAFDAL